MNQNIKSSPRDVFMHLLTIVALYFCAFNFINLVFQFINLGFPDPLNYGYRAGSAMRWSIASLLIIFPAFIWAARFLARDIALNPEKADLRIRKWLVYFTLFAAAIAIIGDLVTLIFNFLEGGLTAPFLLKILTVLLVASAIFGFYMYDLRKKPGSFSKNAGVFVWAISFAVGVAIVAGFFASGSPFKQRQLRFDGERVDHLQSLQWQIVNYWQNKGKLPASLDDLRDSISGFAPPADPETGEQYGYKKTGDLSFELCATFNFSSKEASAVFRSSIPEAVPLSGETVWNWDHEKGSSCFSRPIDPEVYGKRKQVYQ